MNHLHSLAAGALTAMLPSIHTAANGCFGFAIDPGQVITAGKPPRRR